MTPSSEFPCAQERLAALLAGIAGYIDAHTLMSYRVYASFMSGNSTQTGLRAGLWRLAEAGHSLLPIPAFVAGAFIGTLLVIGSPRHPLRRLCRLVAALVFASLAAAFLEPVPGWFSIIVLSMAMAVMNTTIDHVGRQAVRIGFVTGDLLNLGRHLAQAARRLPVSDSQGPWDTHLWRAILLAGVWSSFVMGAVMSGVGTGFLGRSILLPPALILLVLAVCARETSRPTASVAVSSRLVATAETHPAS
jgi:uncharacterized membrane protein YoaK (UPF0700 family)